MGLRHEPYVPTRLPQAGFRFLGQPGVCEQTLVSLGPGPSDSEMGADRASTSFLFLPAWAAPPQPSYVILPGGEVSASAGTKVWKISGGRRTCN